MATTYFGSKPVSDWTPNGSFESGHDFINQINKQQQDINAKKGEYGTQQGTTNQAQQTYEDAYKGQNAYSDLYNQAQKSEGVDEAKAQYQKSLASVNATNSAMNNLPSSINAGSNVVLNASQRNAALGNQMQKYQNTLDYQTRQNAGDLSQYQTALASAQDLAKTNMSQEQTKVAQAMQNYQAQMSQLNELYNQVLNEKNIMRQIYGDMYDDEYNHMQQQLEVWAQNLNAETQRYAQDQETARNNAKIAAEKYAADAGLRLQKYMDQRNDEIAKAKAAEAEALGKARQAANNAGNSKYENTYATEYKASNPLQWITTGGIIGDIYEHGLNWLSGSNVGSYGRYGNNYTGSKNNNAPVSTWK